MNKQLQLLIKFRDLLITNNIEYWLDYGTLLGAIREQKFLSHDTIDIDIGLNQKDYWKVRKLLDNQSIFKYKHIWRAELTIYESEDVHMDLFFYKEDANFMYSYAYLGNKIQGGINIESGMKCLKENIYPLQYMDFYGYRVTIPNNPETHLSEHYGETWKIPDTKWVHTKIQSLDENHRTIGILIPTFLRDKKMQKEVESILKHCDSSSFFRKWIRIYIADQGHELWSKEKIEFYKKLELDGHKVFKTPFNSGLSYNRNFLIQQSNEPYLMIMDDDFEFTENTNLTKMIEILNHKEENGIIGGDIENRPPYNASLIFEQLNNGVKLYRIERLINKQHINNLEYYNTDIVLNFFLAKREVLEEIPLDNELKLVEHTDHFLRIKQTNKWKVCYCPNITCKHIQESDSSEYKNFRFNNDYEKKFKEKWNIKDIIKIKECNISNIKIFQIKSAKLKVVQIARIPCANSGYELSKLLNAYSNKIESRYILGGEYSQKLFSIPYRKFPYDLLWTENKDECIRLIQEADIVHIHHDSWKEIEPYLKNKKVVSTVYNLTNSLQYKDNDFNRNYLQKLKDLGSITVADQPLQKIMFSDISTTYVPLVKMLFGLYFSSSIKESITIGFSPTNHESKGIGSKRYDDVINCINKLKEKYQFQFLLIEGIPYEDNLRLKSTCDILIDDVDDTYEKAHNTTLESALLNAIPLTNYTGKWFPAIKTNINTLYDTLEYYLKNPKQIEEYRKNILSKWRQEVYIPKNLVNIYEKLYNDININPKYQSPTLTTNIIIPAEPVETIKDEFILLDKTLQQNNIEYCIIETSCLDAVRFGELKIEPNNLYLAVKNLDLASNIINLLNLKLQVHLSENFPKQIKEIGFFGRARNIPFPVIKYLMEKYGSGEKWRTYGLENKNG